MFETPLHWVSGIEPHRLALMARPRGGEDLPAEVAAWKAAGVGVVVSLLESAEVRELELEHRRGFARKANSRFAHFPFAIEALQSQRAS